MMNTEEFLVNVLEISTSAMVECDKQRNALLRVARAATKVCERLDDLPMNSGDAATVLDLGKALKEVEHLLEE